MTLRIDEVSLTVNDDEFVFRAKKLLITQTDEKFTSYLMKVWFQPNEIPQISANVSFRLP